MNPAVSRRPGSVRPAQISSPAARKNALRKSQNSLTRQKSSPSAQPMRIPTPMSVFDQSTPNEAERASTLNRNRLADSKPNINERLGNSPAAANENQEAPPEGNDEASTDQEENEGESSPQSKLQAAQQTARMEGSIAEAAGVKKEAAGAQSAAQDVGKKQGKKMIVEGAKYVYGLIAGAVDGCSLGISLIITFIGWVFVLGHYNLELLFGGKIPIVDPVSWDPLPISLLDPTAMGKKLLIIIADIVFVLLSMCAMTLIGIIGYGFAHPLEAIQQFGPAFAQIFAK